MVPIPVTGSALLNHHGRYYDKLHACTWLAIYLLRNVNLPTFWESNVLQTRLSGEPGDGSLANSVT
jgi:hypothetical protein